MNSYISLNQKGRPTQLISADNINFFRLVRFEVFTAVTMKNGVFRDVTPCGPCKTRRFGGT
jgi:hypothetical protein